MSLTDQMRPSSSVQALLYEMKQGHTCSLKNHSLEVTDMLHPRSVVLLKARGPSYPGNVADRSADLSRETTARRTLHREVMTAKPDVFKRTAGEESFTEQLNERRRMNTLLVGMHGLKDLDDLDKQRTARITFSRTSARTKSEKKKLDDHLYNSLLPMDDFLRPDDTSSPRTTGYEQGHIRSLMKADTYGPVSSAMANLERTLGLLPPHTPNIDRYKRDGSECGSTLGSRGSARVNSRQAHTRAAGNARSIGSITTNSTLNSPSPSAQNQSFDVGLFHHTSYVDSGLDDFGFEFSQGGSTKYRTQPAPPAGTLGYYGPAYTEEERELVDPILKRKAYFRTIQIRAARAEEQKKNEQRRALRRQKQDSIAANEKKAMAEFENHLTLTKYKNARRGVSQLRMERPEEQPEPPLP